MARQRVHVRRGDRVKVIAGKKVDMEDLRRGRY